MKKSTAKKKAPATSKKANASQLQPKHKFVPSVPGPRPMRWADEVYRKDQAPARPKGKKSTKVPQPPTKTLSGEKISPYGFITRTVIQ